MTKDEFEIVPRGSMRAAYTYQIVNLIVSVLTVPMLLHFLNVSGYVIWSVFTVFGSVTLQLQNGIQPAAVREIAHGYCGNNISDLRAAIRRGRLAYLLLTGLVAGPILIIGIIYLRRIVDPKLEVSSTPEWLIFIFAYAANYAFAVNSAILLGTARIARQNNINSLTRTIYFFLNVIFLRAGLSVLGICISFALSVALSCFLTSRAAGKRLEEVKISMRENAATVAATDAAPRQSILKYTFYSLTAYLLYNGAILVATAFFPKEAVATYGLSIQTFSLISALSVVPIQVWLNRLVGAIRRRDQSQMAREFVATVVVANSVFLLGSISLAALGNFFLAFLGSSIRLLSFSQLALIFLAYLVELNLIVFANLLVTAGRYKFVKIYVATSITSLALAAGMSWLTHDLILSLVTIPLSIQGAICLPWVFSLVCNELAMTKTECLKAAANFLASFGRESHA